VLQLLVALSPAIVVVGFLYNLSGDRIMGHQGVFGQQTDHLTVPLVLSQGDIFVQV
jgi:hypothetical protein